MDEDERPMGIVGAGATNERSLASDDVAAHMRAIAEGGEPKGVRLHDGDETVAFLELDLPSKTIAQAEIDLRVRAARIVLLLRGARLFASYESAPEGVVMVVDDDENIRALLGKVLGRAGLDVREAADGQSALELAARERPDLILMDWRMPGMSGVEAARLMQSDPALSDIPIIMLTARSSKAERVVAFAAGVQDLIAKPFDINDVVARVREELRWRRLLTSHVARGTGAPADAVPFAVLGIEPEEVQAPELEAPAVLAEALAEAPPAVESTAAGRLAEVEAEIAHAEQLAEVKQYSKAALAYKIAAEYATKYTNPDVGNKLYRLAGKMYLNWAESAHDPISIQRGYAGAARMFLGAGNLDIAKRSAEKGRMSVPAP